MRKLWVGASASLVSVLFAACGGDSSEPSNQDDGTGGKMAPVGDGDGDVSVAPPCDEGEFGPDCAPCTCEHGTCNDGRFQDGTCSECDDGYWGENCDEECPQESDELGMGGAGSVSQCLSVTACEQEAGLPTICGTCAAGFYGKDCSKYCVDNRANCIEVSECTQGGTPTACESCKDGFWGDACEKPCAGAPDHCTEVNVCDEFGDPVQCTCAPGWRGALCDERKVFLLYNSHAAGNAPGELAAEALDFSVSSHLFLTESTQAIVDAYQAEPWDVVIVDVASGIFPSEILAFLEQRAEKDEAMMVSYWELDGTLTLAEELGVTPLSYDAPYPLVVGSDSPVNLFDLRESIPSPLAFTQDVWPDNGDLLTLVGPGNILLRETTAEGAGILTRVGNRFVLGFTPLDYVGTDADADETDDIVELYINLLSL